MHEEKKMTSKKKYLRKKENRKKRERKRKEYVGISFIQRGKARRA